MKKIFNDISYYVIYSWISIKIFVYKIFIWFHDKFNNSKETEINIEE